MEIRTGEEGKCIGKIMLEQGHDWKTVSTERKIDVKGIHPLFFTYKGTGDIDFKEFSMI